MKKNETGRSMVEMLGVLAIIGVLSVGGITGYRTAMDRYKANKLINDIQTGLIEMSAQYKATGSYDYALKTDYVIDEIHPQCALDMEYPCFFIRNVDEGVCQALPLDRSMFTDIGSAPNDFDFSTDEPRLFRGEKCQEGKGMLIFYINPDLFQGEDDYVY